ncbi:MAG: hypothetical protein OEW08_08390 [Gammaproteobacteria bacterium]|nr:hypothetical protein [Gammaproteobacteria bacterium]
MPNDRPITVDDLSHALEQIALAFVDSMPCLVQAINDKKPNIAHDHITALAEKANRNGDTFAAQILTTMAKGIDAAEWDDSGQYGD